MSIEQDKPTSYEDTIYEDPLNVLPLANRSYLSTEDLTDEYAGPGGSLHNQTFNIAQ